MFSAIAGIATSIVSGVTGYFKRKQQLKDAVTKAKIERVSDRQNHDQKWEILSVEQAGWKDDILFYAFIAMFIWAGFDPEGASQFFENINKLPPWFVKTWMWLVASVIGVKKIGDYVPKALKTVKDAIKK